MLSRSSCDEYWYEASTYGEVVPVEVKAGVNTKAKSLSVFRAKYCPRHSLLFTAAPLAAMAQGGAHLPLNLADRFPEAALIHGE